MRAPQSAACGEPSSSALHASAPSRRQLDTWLARVHFHALQSFKKLQEDFQEFVKAHVVEQPSGDAEKKDDK